jgi:hypothetical protein
MISGYVAMTTSVILQFNMKAMTNDVTTKPTLCKRTVERSTTIVRNKVASLSRRDVSIELVLLKSSNQPISFLKMAVIRDSRTVKISKTVQIVN